MAPLSNLPTSVEELQELVRHQNHLLERLTGQRDGLLSRIESSETAMKEALELQLKHATQEKQTLDTSMASLSRDQQERSENFERQLRELRIKPDDLPKNDKLLATFDAVAASNHVDEIKPLAQKLRETVVTQEAVIKKLRFELEMELGHVNILRADNQSLRELSVKLQASAEQEEEYISNKLLKRINNLKREKGELLLRVEQEEELITSTLQKKLQQLQKEKVDMEIALEQEQEFIVNRLQKQLENLRQQQSPAQTPTMKWHPTHSPSSSMADITMPPSPGVVEMLRAEVNALKSKVHEMERDYEEGAAVCKDLYGKLRQEVLQLRARLNIPIDDIDKTYPPVLPTVVPSSGSLPRDRSRSNGPTRRSISESDGGNGSGIGSPKDAGMWTRAERTSRSVSSTRGSINI